MANRFVGRKLLLLPAIVALLTLLGTKFSSATDGSRPIQEAFYFRSYRGRTLHLALPDGQNLPAGNVQPPFDDSVALSVTLKFWFPVFCPRSRDTRFGTAAMKMPEAAMDEYDLAEPHKDEVRTAWQGLNVQPVTESHRVD